MGDFDDLILNDGSKPLDPSKNDYFLVTITDLLPGKTYPIEFRWNYATKEKNPNWSSVVKVTTPAYAPNAVANIVPAWSGTKFTLTFDSNPAASGNENLQHYKIILNSSGGTFTDILLPKTGTTQFYQVEVSKKSSPFNTAVTAISGSIAAVDKDKNESVAISFSLTTRTSSLPTPVITATAINNGYSVSYTTPTADEYDHIEIEEVESNAASDPGTGYSSSFIGAANPAAIIVSSLNKRWVRAKFWDSGGLASSYSTAVAITPTTPITIDTTPPAAPASGSVTAAGIDTSSGSTVGFNAYLDISWSAVSDATLKGYRIRFRKNGSSDPYGYVDSPGTGTTFRLNGLSIGVTYEVAIASYDEFNNTTGTYTSLGTGSAGGIPYIGKNVSTTGYFEAAPSGETGAFRFGYGVQPGYRGLTFNANNYWYINSSANASFKLGSSDGAANYISWDGSTFIVDGNIRAKGGYFAGQLEMQAGAGIYSGTVVSNSLTSDGFLLNTNGLIIKKGSVSLRLDTSDGGVYAQKGTIGNWSIDTNTISSPSGNVPKITLNSSTSQIIASSNTYSAGLAIPESDSGTAIVFWAGNAGRSTSSKFYVTADGTLNASAANISGTITASAISINSNNYWNTPTNLGKFRVGDGSKYLEWDGSNLTATGTINATGGTFSGNITASGTISGGTLSGASVSVSSGTKSINLSSSTATLTITDTDTSYLSSAGIQLQTGTDFGSLSAVGLNISNTSLFTNKVGAGYPVGATVLATNGSELHIGGSGTTAPIIFNYRFGSTNSPFWTGTYSTSSTEQSAGTYLSISGAMISRRDDQIPIFAHRYNSVTAYSGATQYEIIRLVLQGTNRGQITASMTQAPAISAPSDYRLKENIRDYTNSIDVIKSKRLRVFNLKNDPTKTEVVGFIAHEFGPDNSELVIGSKDAVDKDGNPEYQSVAFTNLIPYLTGALKEIILRVEALESRLDALEG